MSLSEKIRILQNKPRRVRERILFVSMIVIAAGLIVVGYFAYRAEPKSETSSLIKGMVGNITDSFKDPEYQKTFGTPSFETVSGQPEAQAQ